MSILILKLFLLLFLFCCCFCKYFHSNSRLIYSISVYILKASKKFILCLKIRAKLMLKSRECYIDLSYLLSWFSMLIFRYLSFSYSIISSAFRKNVRLRVPEMNYVGYSNFLFHFDITVIGLSLESSEFAISTLFIPANRHATEGLESN